MRNITFINAGAGSGKTYQLTEILGEWINEGNDAEEILITTFTKKAAAEIRERAQAKLLESNKFEAANKLQNAFIGTVHSIGHKFIKKYWHVLGISPELNEISDIEKDILFSKAIADVPTQEELKQLNELNSAFDFRKKIGDVVTYNPNQWKDDVLMLMNKSLTNKVDLNDDSSVNLSIDKITKLFKGGIEVDKVPKLLTDIGLVLKNEGTAKRKEPLKNWENITSDISNGTDVNLSILLQIDKLISSLNAAYPDGKKQLYKAVRDQFPHLRIQDFKLFKEANINYTKLIFDIAKRSLKEYKQFKQEKGLIDYTDMEVYFLELLDHNTVKKEIASTIKLVMVDEFQDSNPIQLSIFMKLSELVEKSYWVGDPKQAIYAFRGTDPVLIDAIIKEFTKPNTNNLDIELLKMSWRSTPQLVNFSNKVFEKRILQQATDISLKNRKQIHGKAEDTNFNKWLHEVKITPLAAKETIGLFPARDKSEHLKGNSLKFWNFLVANKGGEYKSAMSEPPYYEKLAAKVAETIKKGAEGDLKVIDKETGKSRNLVGSDICILLSANDKVSKLSDCFKNLGILVNAALSGLSDTVEYRLLQNIITLFIDESNALSITELAYLCGEETDLDILMEKRLSFVLPLLKKQKDQPEYNIYNDLSEWLKDTANSKLIVELKKQSQYLSVCHILQKIVSQFNVFQKLFSYNNSGLRQENVLRIIELAKEYEAYSVRMNLGSGLIGFFNFLSLSDEYNKQAISKNSNAVNIMTYHKAKGLEWPMVILSDLQKEYLSQFEKKEFFTTKVINTSDLEVSDPLKNRVVVFSFWPFGSATSVNEELKESIQNTEEYLMAETAKLNEGSRVLYVGVTRARDYCVFVANKSKKLHWLENIITDWSYETSFNELGCSTTEKAAIDLFGLGEEFKVDFERITPDTTFELIKAEDNDDNYFKKQTPLMQNKPYILNPSNIPPLKNVKIGDVVTIHNRLNTKADNATDLGNTLHQLLYIKNRYYFEPVVKQMAALRELLKDPADFFSNTIYFDDYIQKNFNPIAQHHEYAMEVMIDDQMVVGEADLVIEQEDGLVLIDYKSYPGKYEEITNPSSSFYAGKYSGQLSAYAQMLEKTMGKPVKQKLIYYVVQGKIVELKF